MISEIEDAVKALAKQAESSKDKAGEAMQLTQAVLNLAHARNIIKAQDDQE